MILLKICCSCFYPKKAILKDGWWEKKVRSSKRKLGFLWRKEGKEEVGGHDAQRDDTVNIVTGIRWSTQECEWYFREDRLQGKWELLVTRKGGGERKCGGTRGRHLKSGSQTSLWTGLDQSCKHVSTATMSAGWQFKEWHWRARHSPKSTRLQYGRGQVASFYGGRGGYSGGHI